MSAETILAFLLSGAIVYFYMRGPKEQNERAIKYAKQREEECSSEKRRLEKMNEDLEYRIWELEEEIKRLSSLENGHS